MKKDSFVMKIENSKLNLAINKNDDESLLHFYLGSNVEKQFNEIG